MFLHNAIFLPLAFIAFINGILGWFCGLVGYPGITIQYLLGLVFIPLAWLMGVEYEVSQFIARSLYIPNTH